MLKTLKSKWPLVALVTVSALSMGLVTALLKTTDILGPNARQRSADPADTAEVIDSVETSSALKLALVNPEERAVDLSVMANALRVGEHLAERMK